MAEDRSLELLGRVVDSLRGIDEQTPGAPLKAADWNLLVGAVSDLAGIIVARAEADRAHLERDFAPAAHEHLGQVTLSWLDGATRALIERAANGSVEQTAATERLAGRVAALDGRLTDLNGGVQRIRAGVDGVLDNDQVRVRQIERVQQDVETAKELETRVGRIASNLEGFDATRRDLLAFRDSLRDAQGQQIDIAALRDRLGELDDVRTRLTLASGELVSIRDVERTINRLEESNANTQGNVRGLVTDMLADPGFEGANGLVVRTREMLTPRLDEMDGRITALDPRVTEVGTQVGGLRDQITAIDGRMTAIGVQVDTFAPATGQIGALGERLTAAEALAQTARAEAAAVAGLPARMDALDARAGEMTQRMDGEFARLDTQIGAARAETQAIGARLEPNGDIGGRLAAVGARVDTFAAIEADLGDMRTRLARQEDLLGGTRAEMANFTNQAAAIARLEEGLASVQASRAATDSSVQNLMRRQGEMEGEVVRVGQRLDSTVADVATIRTRVGGLAPIDIIVDRDILRPVNQ